MKFTIGFDKQDTNKLHQIWDEIINTQKWSEGKFTQEFEKKWGKWNESYALAFGSWVGGALAALDYYNLRGKCVLCPSNTFMATALVNSFLGCQVEFVDCNKDDLCMSLDDLEEKVNIFNPAAVWVVHIGGHIVFQIKEIAEFCKERGMVLLEDCAHAHGASWNGRKPGTWADAGIYSLYATKTISTGEGGMLVTKDKNLIEFASKFRNYGKFEYEVQGLNFRMSEFTAAIGCVQVDRLDEIVSWKNEYARKILDPQYPNRVKFPKGMVSGYYKYIVFDPIEKSTGKVYDLPCHKIMKKNYELPNADWIAKNHWCVPLYYKGNE
jgi:dTDP-4-amino-4,6-dideoxygalactose transaminase